jgi:uncharacterized protein (DUF488 family)
MRPLAELVEMLREVEVTCLVDVRRFPSSRRHPQFERDALRRGVEAAGIEYRHEVELGGRRSGEPGEDRFACLRVAAFRSYAARMAAPEWQDALARSLESGRPCFLCAETLWWRCHRRLVAELLHARGHEVVHLVRPGRVEPHVPWSVTEVRAGSLYLCGELVA